MFFSQDIIDLIFWIGALLIAVTIHEFMHAWTANYLGDPTAKYLGRISLNPLVHLDPLGTLALIFFRFGWGKPVPVNPNNFKNPKLGWALVSFAGPLSNMTIAAIFSIPLRLGVSGNLLGDFFSTVIVLNVILMVFNLIPIPPLDGSKILYAFLPNAFDIQRFELYGPILLLALIFFGGGLLSDFIFPIISGVLSFLGVGQFF